MLRRDVVSSPVVVGELCLLRAYEKLPLRVLPCCNPKFDSERGIVVARAEIAVQIGTRGCALNTNPSSEVVSSFHVLFRSRSLWQGFRCNRKLSATPHPSPVQLWFKSSDPESVHAETERRMAGEPHYRRRNCNKCIPIVVAGESKVLPGTRRAVTDRKCHVTELLFYSKHNVKIICKAPERLELIRNLLRNPGWRFWLNIDNGMAVCMRPTAFSQ